MAFPDTNDFAQRYLPCPVCTADAGEPCRSRRKGRVYGTYYLHAARTNPIRQVASTAYQEGVADGNDERLRRAWPDLDRIRRDLSMSLAALGRAHTALQRDDS